MKKKDSNSKTDLVAKRGGQSASLRKSVSTVTQQKQINQYLESESFKGLLDPNDFELSEDFTTEELRIRIPKGLKEGQKLTKIRVVTSDN